MSLKSYIESAADLIVVQEVTELKNGALEIQDGGASGTVLHFIHLDNLLNTAVAYLKMWDSSGSPAINTLEPDVIVPVAAKKETVIQMLNGLSGIFTNPNKMYAIATPTRESGNTTSDVTQDAPTNDFSADFGVATS